MKTTVSSGGFLGEAASESTRVGVVREGANWGMTTWVLTLAAAGWLRTVSSIVMRFSTKVRRPAAQTVAQGAVRAEARRVENLTVPVIPPPLAPSACRPHTVPIVQLLVPEVVPLLECENLDAQLAEGGDCVGVEFGLWWR